MFRKTIAVALIAVTTGLSIRAAQSEPNGQAQDQQGKAASVKAKVEKMNLGGVGDVRSVAVLMKTLQPVLEVITSLLSPDPFLKRALCLHLW